MQYSDPSFKKIPAEFKDTLRQELSGRFSGMRLYACLDAPNGGLELHFISGRRTEK